MMKICMFTLYVVIATSMKLPFADIFTFVLYAILLLDTVLSGLIADQDTANKRWQKWKNTSSKEAEQLAAVAGY